MNILLNNSGILAAGKGNEIVSVLFALLVFVMWIVGAIVKKTAQKRDQQQTQERYEQTRRTPFSDDYDDGWQIIAEPPKPQQAPVPVPVPVPAGRQSKKLSGHHLAASRVVSKELQQKPPAKMPLHDIAAGGPHRILVNLSSCNSVRNAMIFHEIFSLPRALRTGPQLWD